MANNLDELTSSENVFMFTYLVKKGAKVEVTYDLQTVTIDGVIVGTFDGQKSIYSADWTASQDSVTKAAAKDSGISIGGLNAGTQLCSLTDTDLLTVTATVTAMGHDTGQTNVPIRFTNGTEFTLANDADLAVLTAAWYPARLGLGLGYTYEDSETV